MIKFLKKGFTLVELLVVLMLMGIITTAIVMVIRPVSQIYADINYKYEEENGAITLFDYINGELRYATQVQIVSTDTLTMPAAGSLQNFILLGNDTRPTSNKGGRGYAQHGKTANPSARSYCVSESLLADNDYQFTVESYNNKDKQQSLTLNIEGHPMKQNSSGTGFVRNEEKVYNYKEAIQFVNMRYSGKLPNSVTTGFSAGAYDKNKPYTWILFTKPADISSNININPVVNNGFEAPKAPDHKNKVDYNANINVLTLVFQEGSAASGYRLVGYEDCIVNKDDGTAFVDSDNPFAPPRTVDVEIPAGKQIQVYTAVNPHPVYGETADELKSAGSHTVYIYYDGSTYAHDDPFEDPNQYEDTSAKRLEIHYYPTDAELESRGIMISDNDEVFKSSECFYYDNGTPVTKIIEGSVTGANVANNLFIQSYQNQFVATVTFKKKNADVWLHGAVATDTGEALVDADYYTYHEADIAEGGTKKIYIYDNHVYDSEEEVKAQMPGRLDKDILVHFLYDSDNPDQNYAGLTFIDGETLPRSSTTNMHKIPDNETTGDSICRIAQTSNFDITVTLIKAGASVKMYNTSQYGGYGAAVDGYPVLDENSPEEIWVFRGVAYSSTEDMPGYKVIDKHVTVHYLGGGNSTTDGVVLQDLDAYSESSQANGDWIADDGFASFGNSTENPDVEVDVLVRREGTVVGVGGKQVGGSDMEGDVVVELNANSPSDVWIYAGKSYGDDGTSAKNQRDADVYDKMVGELTYSVSNIKYDQVDYNDSTKVNQLTYTVKLENNSQYKVDDYSCKLVLPDGMGTVNQAWFSNGSGNATKIGQGDYNGNFVGCDKLDNGLSIYSKKQNWGGDCFIRIEPGQYVELSFVIQGNFVSGSVDMAKNAQVVAN